MIQAVSRVVIEMLNLPDGQTKSLGLETSALTFLGIHATTC